MRNRRSPRPSAVSLETRIAPAIVSFRQGEGYFQNQTAVIAAESPTVANPSTIRLDVSGSASPAGARQALLRFDGLFGNDPGQIPNNATIVSANLTLWALEGVSNLNVVVVNDMILPWNPSTATWDLFGDGIQSNNVEAALIPTATRDFTPAGFQVVGQALAATIQYWAVLNNNYGLVLSASGGNSWAFAGPDDPIVSHRPCLSVCYEALGHENPSYAQLAGPPPSPRQLAWFDWSDDLIARRQQRVPNVRTNTFYFAQNGNDATGLGTIEQPWKSLAKAEELLDESQGANMRLRFRRGDLWQETTVLNIGAGVTVEDYGDVNLAKPRFSRFQSLDPLGWTLVGGTLYKRNSLPSVGWVRETSDPLDSIYYRAASSAEVAQRQRSWYYDSAGTDPNSGAQPTLYVNTGGNAATITGGLEYCPGDGVGWQVAGDNVRLQNLRIEGSGVNSSGQGYGLKIVQQGSYWEFVGVGLEVYYAGYHAIGQIGQYLGSHSVVTLVDCSAGLCVNRDGAGFSGSGDITVFVSYSDFGGNEYIQLNCEARFGALPSSDWVAVPGLAHGQALYTHTSGIGYNDLTICQGTKVGDSDNPVAIINNIDAPRPAATLEEVRAFIVEDQPGKTASWWNKDSVAVINCVIDRRSPPPSYDAKNALLFYGPFNVGGWLINCTAAIDARNQYNGIFYVIYCGTDSSKLINCHFDIFNCVADASWHFPFQNASAFYGNSSITNSIISLSAPLTTSLNMVNDAAHLVHNAYFLSHPPADPALGYSGDLGSVTLSQRYPVGVRPTPSSPLFNGGIDVGLEYDQNRQPRYGLKSIGPLQGVTLPAPSDVDAQWGVRSTPLIQDTILPVVGVNRFQLRFSTDVDVTMGALQLWNESSVLPMVNFAYDSTSRIGTWTLAAPLSKGRYILELDGQPLRGFSVLPGDVNGSGHVDLADFSVFRSVLGTTSALGDIDGDGDVDLNDFSLFRQWFNASL